MKKPIKIIVGVFGGLLLLSLILWAIPGEQVFGASRFSPGGGSPLSPGLFTLSGTVISPAPGLTLSGGGGSGAVPQLTQVINAGATATSTPNFSMGFTATTGTISGALSANTVSSTRFSVDHYGTASDVSFGRVGVNTGMAISGSGQIVMVVNGNPQSYFDGSNGFQTSTITPISPGTGSIGTAASTFLNGNITNVTSSNVAISNLLQVTGTATSTFNGSVSSTKYLANFGSAATPAYGFPGGWGLTMNGPNQLTLNTGGVARILMDGSDFTVNENLRPLTSGNFDNGLLTAQWRNGYYAGFVSSVGMYITGAPAAGTGLNPFCSGTGGQVTVGSAGVCPVSALDMKNNVRPIKYGLDEILKTDFYDFELKNDPDRERSGVVADWSDKVMPEYTIRDKDGKIIGVDTNSIVAVQGQAIKELSAKLEAQQKEIHELKMNQDWLTNAVKKLLSFLHLK